jgi:predicted rRNA methylase YqxC with S4 and FtsJ domains
MYKIIKKNSFKLWLLLETTTIEEITSEEMIDHLNLMVIEVSIITTLQIMIVFKEKFLEEIIIMP